MHDVLFEQDQPLDDESLARSARQAKLDMERYTREMAEGIYSMKVEEDFKSALYSDHVTGTPTLYLNGVLLSSVHGFDGLLAAVGEAGATLRADSGGRTDWLLEEARSVSEACRVDYNERRPHRSLQHLTPAEFAAKCSSKRSAELSL